MVNKKDINICISKIKELEQESIIYRDEMKEIMEKYNNIKKKWKNSISEIKEQKNEVQILKKNIKKRTRKESLNGFTKPIEISENLKIFLNLDTNITTRNIVWKSIYGYIKENNLLDNEDKRYFNLNGKAGENLKIGLNLNQEKTNSIYSIRKDIENNIIKK